MTTEIQPGQEIGRVWRDGAICGPCDFITAGRLSGGSVRATYPEHGTFACVRCGLSLVVAERQFQERLGPGIPPSAPPETTIPLAICGPCDQLTAGRHGAGRIEVTGSCVFCRRPLRTSSVAFRYQPLAREDRRA